MSSITVGGVSLVVWLLLWGDLSVGNVVSGILVAAVLMVVFPNDGPFWPRHFFHPVHALHFVGYFVLNLIVSNFLLSKEILRGASGTRTRVVTVPMPDCTPAMLTFVANVTALTPGTMAVDASNEPPQLTVHVLLLHDPDEARASVDKLRYLAVRAFGGAQARHDCVRLIEAAPNVDPDPEEEP